jgi:hypothetical protein
MNLHVWFYLTVQCWSTVELKLSMFVSNYDPCCVSVGSKLDPCWDTFGSNLGTKRQATYWKEYETYRKGLAKWIERHNIVFWIWVLQSRIIRCGSHLKCVVIFVMFCCCVFILGFQSNLDTAFGKLRSIPDEGEVSVDLAHGLREAEKHPRRRCGLSRSCTRLQSPTLFTRAFLLRPQKVIS